MNHFQDKAEALSLDQNEYSTTKSQRHEGVQRNLRDAL